MNNRIKELEKELRLFKTLYPPGHYYSPLPDIEYIRTRRHVLFSLIGKEIPGMVLKEKEQFELLVQLSRYYSELPFSQTKTEGMRYYYENDYYTYSDAI